MGITSEFVAETTPEAALLFAGSEELVLADDAELYERERGKPMPNIQHGSIQANLIVALSAPAYKRRYRVVSELTIALAGVDDEGNRKRSTPDICLYERSAVNFLHVKAVKEEPPLLAIEIVSPSQTLDEFLHKAESYFASGVQSCWIVQPPIQAVTVLHPNERPRTFVEGMVEDASLGISIPIEEVFE